MCYWNCFSRWQQHNENNKSWKEINIKCSFCQKLKSWKELTKNLIQWICHIMPLLSTLKRDNEIKKLKVERKCAEIVALSWAYCNVYPVHTLDRKYGIMKLWIKIHLLIDSFIIPYFLWKSYSKPLVLK